MRDDDSPMAVMGTPRVFRRKHGQGRIQTSEGEPNVAKKTKFYASIFDARCLSSSLTFRCDFRIREFIYVRPTLGFNNWADRGSNREADRSRQRTRRLFGDDCDRRCRLFCCLLSRKASGLDFRQSRQLAAGWLHPITCRGCYPAACLPFYPPAIPAMNATSQPFGPNLTQGR